MIIRVIKTKTEECLRNFDWFNDYQDTRSWAVHNAPEVVPLLDAGHEKWLKEHNDRIMNLQPQRDAIITILKRHGYAYSGDEALGRVADEILKL